LRSIQAKIPFRLNLQHINHIAVVTAQAAKPERVRVSIKSHFVLLAGILGRRALLKCLLCALVINNLENDEKIFVLIFFNSF
jgi:hypothetical protein